MKTYKVLYWTYDNWDGDPDEITIELDKIPTIDDVEDFLFSGVRSVRSIKVIL